MKFSSFAVFETIVEEANERFSPLFAPVQERIDVIRQYCSVLDGMIEEFEGESFECEIDEIDMTVRFDLVLPEIVVDSPKTKQFTQLISRAKRVEIKNNGGETLLVRFIFPSLWEKV